MDKIKLFKEWYQKEQGRFHCAHFDTDAIARACFAKGYDYAEKESNSLKQKVEWISVEDRLPKAEDNGVLVFFSETDSIETVHIQDYFDDITNGLDGNGEQLYTKWYLTQKVTHWMPLPEPPTQE